MNCKYLLFPNKMHSSVKGISFFLIFIILFHHKLVAQSYEIQKITSETLELNQCPVDPSAHTYLHFDISQITIQNKSESVEYTDQNCDLNLRFFEVTYKRDVRLKFVDVNENDKKVFSFQVEASDKLQSFKGSLYYLDKNKIIKSNIKRKELSEEIDKQGNKIYTLNFPDLRPGCIVDIEYTLKSSDFDILPSWKLSTEYPILYCEISYVIPDFLVYEKKFAIDQNISRNVTHKESHTSVNYRGNDIIFKKYTYQEITEKYSVKNLLLVSDQVFSDQFIYSLKSKNLNSVPFDKSVWKKVN